MARTRVGDTNVYCDGCFTWIATKRKEVLKREEGKMHLTAVPLIAIEKGCERCSTAHVIRLDSDRPTVGGVLSVIVLAFVSIV